MKRASAGPEPVCKKAKKVTFSVPEEEIEEEDGPCEVQRMLSHPVGVQPWGNIFLDDQGPEKAGRLRLGLGPMASFTDDLILDVLGYLDPTSLALIGRVSPALYAFSREDSLWRPLVLEEYGGHFHFHSTWRETFLLSIAKSRGLSSLELSPLLNVAGLYSDYLFQLWRCASADLEQWTTVDNVDRRSDLTLEEFVEQYERPGKPVILTGIVPKWLAFSGEQAERTWTCENFLKRFGDVSFKAGAVEMTLHEYWNYARQTQEESPIYLFDNEFIEKAPPLGEEYQVESYFAKDYFSLLDDLPRIRPSYRWILIGPPRSGSTFHKDPNYTSAWNGVISGRKKWILFPPEHTPPGVIPSCDELDVTTPISVTEWFLNFYSQARKEKPYECVQKAGELLFIPHRWWHSALNLEECVAVTQNYVNDQNLIHVLNFLKKCNKKRIIEPLEARLEQTQPGLLAKLQAAHDKATHTSSSAWEKLMANTESEPVFKFSFQ